MSYYARRDAARPEWPGPDVAIAALRGTIAVAAQALGVAGRALGGRPARMPAVTVLAVALVAAALLALVLHGRSAPPAELASNQASPAPAASPPAVTPPPVAAVPSPDETATPSPRPSPSPRTTPSPSPASVTFLNAPLTGHVGPPVTLQVRTTPRTTCSIDIGYTSAPDLDPAQSDSQGRVSWTWRLSRSAPTGTWPVTVTCGGVSAGTQIVVS